MRPGNKYKHGLLGEKRMFRNVLEGIIPIDDLLAELEREILEAFKLTEKTKETDEISTYITKEYF